MTGDHRSEPHIDEAARQFPDSLHICTYDLRGTVLRTGQLKRCRESGLVTHTHHLLAGFARAYPNLRLVITQTGALGQHQ